MFRGCWGLHLGALHDLARVCARGGACAPAVPASNDTQTPPPQHTKRLATVLRRLHTARIDRDYAQYHFLQKEAAAICSGLNIPYVPTPVVKVPDLTGPQRAAIGSVIRSLVKKVPVPRWHKQAIRASVRVVRTVPHSLRKVVEKQEKETGECISMECGTPGMSLQQSVQAFVGECR